MRRSRLAGQLAEPISHRTDGVEAAGFLDISGMLPVDAAGEAVSTVRRRYFGAARPASTLAEVSALAQPGALVEIEAAAQLPGSGSRAR